MEKERVRKFKNRQKRLAKKLAKALGYELDSVTYEEYLPGASKNPVTGKITLEEKSQIRIPGSKIKPLTKKKQKQRIRVIIKFKEDLVEEDIKIINSILKRQYFPFYPIFTNAISYSVNPDSI